MKVSILQTNIAWANIEDNLTTAGKLISDCSGSDVIVLPEMFSTGFATSPMSIADEKDTTLLWMKQMAQQSNAAIAGSVAIGKSDIDKTGKRFFNRHYFVFPDGNYSYYDKRHLFSYGGENTNYTAGSRRVIVEWRGLRFLLATCYDLRFPVWMRNRNEYDAIIIVANWPDSRQTVWETLLTARAIENQCYVIAANRVGSDLQCNYIGGSRIIDAKGKVIAGSKDANEQIISTDISLSVLSEFRNKFRVLEDADKFTIKV